MSEPIKFKRGTVGLIFLAVIFTLYSENFLVAPLLAEIAKTFGVSIESAGALVAIYTAAVGTGALACGPLSDVYGRKPLLMGGLLCFGAATFGCAGAWNWGALVAFRILAGASAGIISSNIFAMVGDYCFSEGRPGDIPIMMGKVTSGIFAALVLGIPFGIWFGNMVNWRMPFVVLGAVTVVLLLVFLVFDQRIPKKLGAGWQESYLTMVKRYFAFLNQPSLLRLCSLFFLTQAVATGFGTYSPYWILQHGITLNQMAWIYILTGIISTIVSMNSGKFAVKLGPARLINIGSVGIVASLIALAGAGSESLLFIAPLCVYMAAMSLRLGPLQAIAAGSVEPRSRGQFMALTSFCMQAGSCVGVFMLSKALTQLNYEADVFHGFDVMAGILCVITALMIALNWGTAPRSQAA